MKKDTEVPNVTVNLRGMPAELVRRAKASAAMCGQSLKAFTVEALKRACTVEESDAAAQEALHRPRKAPSSQVPGPPTPKPEPTGEASYPGFERPLRQFQEKYGRDPRSEVELRAFAAKGW